MNVVKAVRDYVTKMAADTPGMKVLLLDADTVVEQNKKEKKKKNEERRSEWQCGFEPLRMNEEDVAVFEFDGGETPGKRHPSPCVPAASFFLHFLFFFLFFVVLLATGRPFFIFLFFLVFQLVHLLRLRFVYFHAVLPRRLFTPSTPSFLLSLLARVQTQVVSMVYAQSEMLQKEVYLIERVDQPNREAMTHLKAVVFVRPTAVPRTKRRASERARKE